MTWIALVIASVLLPVAAAAHPDHASGGDFGLVHFLTSPFHVGLTAGAVLLFLAARKLLLQRHPERRRR